MSEAENIYVCGIGAVSPAGWGVAPLRDALCKSEPLPTRELARPGWHQPLRVRTVPLLPARPAFLIHSRLRRTSPIAQYTVAAALEALGSDGTRVANGSLRLGLVQCVMTGCVNYSRRFYDETLKDPATASPLVFPETVFNAPASHLAAVLGTTSINYTLVGDPGTFVQGIALAANWLSSERVAGCLVIGAEETDWLTADAYRLFARKIVVADGAGAVYLRRHLSATSPVQLKAVTQAHLFSSKPGRADAAKRVRVELPASNAEHLLCDGIQGIQTVDADELRAWRDWTGARLSPKLILGEGLAAASAWQCVAAIDALIQRRFPAASVAVVGCNEQAIGAHFTIADSKS